MAGEFDFEWEELVDTIAQPNRRGRRLYGFLGTPTISGSAAAGIAVSQVVPEIIGQDITTRLDISQVVPELIGSDSTSAIFVSQIVVEVIKTFTCAPPFTPPDEDDDEGNDDEPPTPPGPGAPPDDSCIPCCPDESTVSLPTPATRDLNSTCEPTASNVTLPAPASKRLKCQ